MSFGAHSLWASRWMAQRPLRALSASTGSILIGVSLWLWLASPLIAALPVSQDSPSSPLVVYVREGCPHCASAKRFLDALRAEAPGLRIELRPVETPEYAHELIKRSQAAGVWPPGVPAFVIADTLLVGFDVQGQRATELRERLLGKATPTMAAAPASSPTPPADARRASMAEWLDVSTVEPTGVHSGDGPARRLQSLCDMGATASAVAAAAVLPPSSLGPAHPGFV